MASGGYRIGQRILTSQAQGKPGDGGVDASRDLLNARTGRFRQRLGCGWATVSQQSDGARFAVALVKTGRMVHVVRSSSMDGMVMVRP